MMDLTTFRREIDTIGQEDSIRIGILNIIEERLKNIYNAGEICTCIECGCVIYNEIIVHLGNPLQIKRFINGEEQKMEIVVKIAKIGDPLYLKFLTKDGYYAF